MSPPCKVKTRCETTKKGYLEQLEKHKSKLESHKARLEGLYSVHSRTKDKELTEEVKEQIWEMIGTADALITDYSGALKPMKLAIDPHLQ